MCGGLGQAIEALVLYEDVAIDGPSFNRTLIELPTLAPYSKWCNFLSVDLINERDVY